VCSVQQRGWAQATWRAQGEGLASKIMAPTHLQQLLRPVPVPRLCSGTAAPAVAIPGGSSSSSSAGSSSSGSSSTSSGSSSSGPGADDRHGVPERAERPDLAAVWRWGWVGWRWSV
jgi:hypothetical protein